MSRNKPSTDMLFIRSTILLILFVCTNLCSMQPVAILQTTRAILPPTTTTTSMPSIEDPTEFETTNETSEEDSWHCFKCFDQITETQILLHQYENLQEQENKHLKERASKEVSNASGSSTRKPKKQQPTANIRSQKNNTSSSNISTRKLDSSLSRPTIDENNTIVVSRLRVARSPPAPISGLDGIMPLLDKERNFPKNNVDPVLKKLKLQQKRHYNSTCKAIQKLKTCLLELSKDCLGNLQFHAMEVFTKQWDNKLDCPKPGLWIFPNLRSTLHRFDDAPRRPTARPPSSNDEISQRMQEMLSRGSPGRVMLRPNLSTHGSQRIEAMRQPGNQQPQDISGQKTSQMKARNGFVDITGIQVPLVGQLLLLVPCLAIAIMALLALINISICHPREESKK